MKKKYVLSEGEELIREYLEEEVIKAISQKDILNLKNDSSSKRIADFYLPDYKVYIEFFGQYSNPKHRERYLEKKRVYKENNIPCVYLYPDNLGTLSFILKRRIKVELQKYEKLKFRLFRWNWRIFIDKFGLFPFLALIMMLYTKSLGVNVILGLFFLSFVYSALKDSFLRKI